MHYYELFIIEICFPKCFIIHIVTFVYAREYLCTTAMKKILMENEKEGVGLGMTSCV
jgi:hypothetical protein